MTLTAPAFSRHSETWGASVATALCALKGEQNFWLPAGVTHRSVGAGRWGQAEGPLARVTRSVPLPEVMHFINMPTLETRLSGACEATVLPS